MNDCIVIGAGFAGLSCARALAAQGHRVTVLEARDRLGGRTCTATLAGHTVDVGGQWIGDGHSELSALAADAGVTLRDQYVEGDKLLHLGEAEQGSMRRYRGLIPKVNPYSLLELEFTIRRIRRWQGSLDPDAPWQAARAVEWDRQTLDSFARRHLRSASARAILDIATRAVLTSDPGNLSLLGFLFYCASNQDFDFLTSARGGAQHQVVEGGMVQLAEHLARPIRDQIQLEQPVTAVRQGAAGTPITVETPSQRLQARRVVCAVPPALQPRIRFEPGLPAARAQLAARMPMGSVIKCVIAYERPFWRDDGLSGEAVSHRLPFNTVFDASPLDGGFGALVGFIDGPAALHWSAQGAERRKAAVLDSLGRYFGPAARTPLDYTDKDWLTEEWTRGCYGGLMTPGLLTELGPALRAPVGGIHWAGTETASRWCGYIEGAILSGRRAATEIAGALNTAG